MTDVMRTTTTTKKSKAPQLFSDELIDQLLAQVQHKNAESIIGESGLAAQLKKRLPERMLSAELTHHLATQAALGKSSNHERQNMALGGFTPKQHLGMAA